MKSVTAKGPWLEITSEEGKLSLQLGALVAEKWAQKILHPPSRLDKLGVKPGMLISLAGLKDSAFISELEARGDVIRSRHFRARFLQELDIPHMPTQSRGHGTRHTPRWWVKDEVETGYR